MSLTLVVILVVNIAVLLIIFIFFKNALNSSLELTLSKLQNENIGQVSRLQHEFSDKLVGSLDTGLNKTQKTLETVIEKVSKVDSASGHVKDLAQQVLKLQEVLTDKKSRGGFGEAMLENLLKNVLGAPSDSTYKTQYKFSNNSIADAVLITNDNLLAIDSKFPMENFLKLNESEDYKKEFKKNIKKHIDDISSKYIIDGETINQAIMFIPSEAIFLEIYQNHSDLVEYSWDSKVWLSSPTTMLAILSSTLLMLEQKRHDEKSEIIFKELKNLADDFGRFKIRWETANSRLKSAMTEVDKISISTDKLFRKFEKISSAEVE